MAGAACFSWDPKDFAGSVVGGRWQLEDYLTSSVDAVVYSATDKRSARAVVVELSTRPAQLEPLQNAKRVGKIDEGMTEEGLRYVVMEQTPDLGERKVMRRVRDGLVGTCWQAEDGSLFVELPPHPEASRAIRRAALHPTPRWSASGFVLPPPASRPAFESDDLTPVVPLRLTHCRPVYEPSLDDTIPVEESDPEIPVYVEPSHPGRPVVSERHSEDSQTPLEAKSHSALFVLMATLCVACALVGHVVWRGASTLLPAAALSSPSTPRPAAAVRQGASITRLHAVEPQPTSGQPLSSAPATGTTTTTATEADAVTTHPMPPRARRAATSQRPRKAKRAVAPRRLSEPPAAYLKSNPYDFLPGEP